MASRKMSFALPDDSAATIGLPGKERCSSMSGNATLAVDSSHVSAEFLSESSPNSSARTHARA